jgi:hypothetical protein
MPADVDAALRAHPQAIADGGDWLLVHDQNTPERPAG